MIEAEDFIGPARAAGFDFWTGVPCSFLTPFINSVIDDPGMQYISSANEGDAVAAATGAALGGRRAVAMMQNSGLGNAVSPLGSLNWVFRIPILLIVTLRGEPGLGDEPQHELMGTITGRILDDLQVPWELFPGRAADVGPALVRATETMDATARPFAFIMRKGSVAPATLETEWQSTAQPGVYSGAFTAPADAELGRGEALRIVVDRTPVDDTVVIGTTGYTGRELFAVSDRPNQLYLVGAMGCASSLALGLSLVQPDRRVVVLDGDGAALMRMGNLATVGAYGGRNLIHLVLDNAMHESTGGQATVSAGVSFAAIACACGYLDAKEATAASALAGFLDSGSPGPRLLQLRTRPGVARKLPRPDRTPLEVGRRLMAHLGVAAPWARL